MPPYRRLTSPFKSFMGRMSLNWLNALARSLTLKFEILIQPAYQIDIFHSLNKFSISYMSESEFKVIGKLG